MQVAVREYEAGDIPAMLAIWNEVVDEGVAFPQTEQMTLDEAAEFFAEQSLSAVGHDAQTGEILGLYVLHPNNVGRCGHIANASYAVKSQARGRRVGEALVRHSIEHGARLGFEIMQFNAVVRTNHSALRLYEKLGFVRLGTIPRGFLLRDGTMEDIILMYRILQ